MTPTNDSQLLISLRTISDYAQVDLPKDVSDEMLVDAFAEFLDRMIHTDMNRVMVLLYRVDVDENKIKQALAMQSGETTAGRVLANLLIERQLEKLAFREQYRQGKV